MCNLSLMHISRSNEFLYLVPVAMSPFLFLTFLSAASNFTTQYHGEGTQRCGVGQEG